MACVRRHANLGIIGGRLMSIVTVVMSIVTVVEAREHLDSKMMYILLSELDNRIDEVNTTFGVSSSYEIPYPTDRVVGLDSIRMDQNSNATDYPVVTVYEVQSNNQITDIVESQDDIITYEVVCAVASDAGDMAWAAKTAKYLSLCAAEVLVKYLPESPGDTNTSVTYRADQVSTAQSRTVPIKPGRLYMSAFAVRFEVYTRTLYGYTPRLFDPNLTIDPWSDSLFDPIDCTPNLSASTGPTGIAADMVASNYTAASVATFIINSSDDIIVDFTGENVPDGSTFFATNQRTFGSTTGTVSGGLATISIAGLTSLASGDVVTIVVKHLTFNTPLTYVTKWTFT
jgi:hypothetical protein